MANCFLSLATWFVKEEAGAQGVADEPHNWRDEAGGRCSNKDYYITFHPYIQPPEFMGLAQQINSA
jgi:hypothetical protein